MFDGQTPRPEDSPAMPRRPALPKDPSQRAKALLDSALGKGSPKVPDSVKVVVSEFARQGGLKGGKARAQKLSSKTRSEIARKAATARWHKDDR